eukprot:7934338-Pyramimonas_sp.AAC.1
MISQTRWGHNVHANQEGKLSLGPIPAHPKHQGLVGDIACDLSDTGPHPAWHHATSAWITKAR